MTNKAKLLFIHTGLSSFVKGDLEILQKEYEITTYKFQTHKSYKLIFSLLNQFFFLLFHIWKFHKIYIWFSDYHSFLPTLFARIAHKESYLVIGGYDVCRIKTLNYGSFNNPIRGFMTLFSIKYCTINLCVSKNVQRKIKWIAPKAKTVIIYNAVPFTVPPQLAPKENIILTIGNINSRQRIQIKGIDRFLNIARIIPDYQFIIIGIQPELLDGFNITSNVHIYEFIPQEQLTSFYQKAKIYMQLSRSESFCLTLAEAMYHNCIPIVTNVGGMPEVVGNSGYIVNENKLDILPVMIKKIMESELCVNGQRSQIENHFLLKLRENGLLEIMR